MTSGFESFDPKRVESPCFVIDKARVEANVRLLADVQARSGARILAALKAFSLFALAPLQRQYLAGTAASGAWEARLGREEYGGEVHVFSPAYGEKDIEIVLEIADHVVFNSPSQWLKWRQKALQTAQKRPDLRFGLRLNPQHSEAKDAIYDPCQPACRLGTVRAQLDNLDLSGLTGFHFHTLCEQGLAPLRRTLAAVEDRFGEFFADMEWINFGGGHLITAPDYDRAGLIDLIGEFRARTGLDVYLEPGEAVALEAGVLIGEVMDITCNDMDLAILDVSATCHMPDVIEAPYRPDIIGARDPAGAAHVYRLGGPSCLAGDIIGDYGFDRPLAVGERVMIADQAHYTMVKTNTFNGVALPAIAIWDSRDDSLEIVRRFAYEDFRNRLS